MDLASLISLLRNVLGKINAGELDFWTIVDIASALIDFLKPLRPTTDNKILFGEAMAADPILEGQLVSICAELCSAIDQEGDVAPVFQGVLIEQIGAAAIAALFKALERWLAANGFNSL